MRDRFPLLLVAGLLFCGLLFGLLLQGARRSDFADVLSSWRAAPDGAKALYLLAQEEGLPVSRRTEDLAQLEGRHGLVLLGIGFSDEEDATPEETELVDGPDAGVSSDDVPRTGLNPFLSSGVDEQEAEALLEHVARGATLVYAPWGARENGLLKALHVELRKADVSLGLRTLQASQVTPWTWGVERVEAKVQSFLRLPSHAVPLLEDAQLSAPVAALVPHGQGRVFVLGAPQLASNEALGLADNATFLLRLLSAAAEGEGPLQFDEYHHGFRNERSVVDFARRYGLQWAVAQLLVGLVLWAGSLKRFGPPRALEEEARVGAGDVLSATARLYRAGRHHAHAAGVLVREVAQSLGPLAGTGVRASPEEVAVALEARERPLLAASLRHLDSLAARATREQDVVATAEAAAALRRLALPPPASPSPTSSEETTP